MQGVDQRGVARRGVLAGVPVLDQVHEPLRLRVAGARWPLMNPNSRSLAEPWKSSRNRDSTASGPALASSGKLSITAFVCDLCPLARTNDHAEAALTRHDTPGTPVQDPQTGQASARQVKRQAETNCPALTGLVILSWHRGRAWSYVAGASVAVSLLDFEHVAG